jgi:hypothetical protein
MLYTLRLTYPALGKLNEIVVVGLNGFGKFCSNLYSVGISLFSVSTSIIIVLNACGALHTE